MLTPEHSQLIFLDHQPQMAFGVRSIDRQTLKNKTVGLAESTKIFDARTIITTVETNSFSGHTYPELLDAFPRAPRLERTFVNCWDDQKVRDALAKGAAEGRKKILVSDPWTEVCDLTFALSCMADTDCKICIIANASGGTSEEAQRYAMDPDQPGSTAVAIIDGFISAVG